MSRFSAFLFSVVLLISFPYGVMAQDVAQPEKLPAVKKPQGDKASSDLLEAQRRIDRLEAQIVEMQSMIGALQTMVQQRGGQLKLQQIKPDVQSSLKTQKPDYQTQGWGADSRRTPELENTLTENDRMTEDQRVSRARMTTENPRKLYDAGYNYLIANNYTAAETTFRSFLRNYPQDQLSGNAQYWLGETFFARGDYRQAANEFLRGYKTYKQSQKSPDNLLKLGMSLQRLGQSEAACQTFAELKSKYRKLPGHVDRRLSDEHRRAGC